MSFSHKLIDEGQAFNQGISDAKWHVQLSDPKYTTWKEIPFTGQSSFSIIFLNGNMAML